MAFNSCLISFLILIFLFYALPSKIVVFVVKLKKSTSRLKDVIDLIQYIVFIFCGILGTCLTKWMPSETPPVQPPKSETTIERATSSSPTSQSSAVTATVEESEETKSEDVESSSSSTDSQLKCPDTFAEAFLATDQLYQQSIKSSKSKFTQWIVRLSLIISITLVNWNLHFDSFSPAMEIFAWSSNISQLTVGIMASTIITGYIGELSAIKSSFSWINLFLGQCNTLSSKLSPTVKSDDLNDLIDFVSNRFNQTVSMVTLSSKLKKFCFSLLFTTFLIALTSMTLDSTQSIGTFKSTSGHYIITTSTAILSLSFLFSIMSAVHKESSKCQQSLCLSLLAYPNYLHQVYPRLDLIRSSIFTLRPKFLLFGSLRLEVPLFLMLSLIFMVEITRFVN